MPLRWLTFSTLPSCISCSCTPASPSCPQHFKRATLFFSEGSPHLAKVILAMDHLNKFLTTSAQSRKLDSAIRVACKLAKKTLNTYYSHTDMSKTYRIAMGMSESPYLPIVN